MYVFVGGVLIGFSSPTLPSENFFSQIIRINQIKTMIIILEALILISAVWHSFQYKEAITVSVLL